MKALEIKTFHQLIAWMPYAALNSRVELEAEIDDKGNEEGLVEGRCAAVAEGYRQGRADRWVSFLVVLSMFVKQGTKKHQLEE